jgi:hypothetical protein
MLRVCDSFPLVRANDNEQATRRKDLKLPRQERVSPLLTIRYTKSARLPLINQNNTPPQRRKAAQNKVTNAAAELIGISPGMPLAF